MNNLTYEQYVILYAKYLDNKNFESILGDTIKRKKDIVCLDLCGGTGDLSEFLLNKLQTKKVWYVDENSNMIRSSLIPHRLIKITYASVRNFIFLLNNWEYDVVVCKQAINYWFNEEIIKQLHKSIKKHGILMFNTFTNIPETYSSKKYTYNNRNYFELNTVSKNNIIMHTQHCEDLIDTNSFPYISEKEFKDVLEKYFNIDLIKIKNSAYYICKKI
ncbi:class I SAM-dependent methyltransferase [Candidatus Pacearchaeota archaeon]|jgi:ubiquinone/menaquinone biosynthesis C-methylase UbiE|nr:class I SAM-dependent methyltransferase [bacterium]MCK9597196.1 class I SAM-dependent methyltransferase [Candidatus Pacearchaeota archaeon]